MISLALLFRRMPAFILAAAGFTTGVFFSPTPSAAALPEVPGFHVLAPGKGSWRDILTSFSLVEQEADQARVVVLPEGAPAPGRLLDRVQRGGILILEGDSSTARSLGIHPTSRRVSVKTVRDSHRPDLPIRWRNPVKLPLFALPGSARVLARDRVHKTPLMASVAHGSGSVLWLALSPGDQGYERFPFLLHALSDLGVRPLFESRRLWAFFDCAYQRDRAPEALAREWRRMGLAAVHVGAWDFFEPATAEDERLRRLIEACHREGILVYAWLELPHVSNAFWERNPRWREKTARLGDARVDWRLLMNLADPDCRDAVIKGIRGTLMRFDWDGVNFAELYFDGVEGIRKPSEFTPMNRVVRREVKRSLGFDPIELFNGRRRDPAKLRAFLDYRVDLAARLQELWIDELEKMRSEKPHLDLVLTHVDDRFDSSMRDAIGADAARLLKVLDRHELTFIIEDPCTLWRLGPKRYSEIAARYRPLTPRQDRLGVDINVVEREKAYPTGIQTGVELAQLIHTAAVSFPTVMFYYTGAITDLDAPLLPPASAVVTHCEQVGDGLLIESRYDLDVRWTGPATLDGQAWPMGNGERVRVPAGRHILRPAAGSPAPSVTDFTGDLEDASVKADGVELRYSSLSRAFARLERRPSRLLIDGKEATLDLSGPVLRLPRGRHTVMIIW